MDKHLIFYIMFFPTMIFFFWGLSLHVSMWLEGTLEGARSATKREKFKIYIANLSEVMAEHPPFPRIMMREIASGWTHFSEAVVKDIAGILIIVKEIIDEGVAKGVFIGINPLVVHLMVIGTLLLFNLSLPMRKNYQYLLAGKIDVAEGEALDNIIPEVQRIMLRALKGR